MTETAEFIAKATGALKDAAESFDPDIAGADDAAAIRAEIAKGEFHRAAETIKRDAERVIAIHGIGDPKIAALTAKGLEAVDEAFHDLPESLYLEIKDAAEADEKPLTLSAIRKANPQAPPPPPKGESEKEALQKEISRLKAENDRLSKRVTSLESELASKPEDASSEDDA